MNLFQINETILMQQNNNINLQAVSMMFTSTIKGKRKNSKGHGTEGFPVPCEAAWGFRQRLPRTPRSRPRRKGPQQTSHSETRREVFRGARLFFLFKRPTLILRTVPLLLWGETTVNNYFVMQV